MSTTWFLVVMGRGLAYVGVTDEAQIWEGKKGELPFEGAPRLVLAVHEPTSAAAEELDKTSQPVGIFR